MITRLIYAKQTKAWPKLCEEAANRLNNRMHSSIGMAPSEVSLENAGKVFNKLYPELAKNQQPKVGLKPKFRIGDKVRIFFPLDIFEKGDSNRTSDEVYIVARILFHPVIRYKLAYISTKEIITGSYNELDLIKSG